MASLARSILSASVTALQVPDGTGSWHNDLSGTGTVVLGVPLRPEQPVQVFVAMDGFSTVPGPPLGHYQREYRVGVVGFVPGADALGDRLLEATDLLDDIVTALESDRCLGLGSSGVRDLTIEANAFDGAELGFDGMGVATAVMTVTAVVRTGA